MMVKKGVGRRISRGEDNLFYLWKLQRTLRGTVEGGKIKKGKSMLENLGGGIATKKRG